MVQTWSGIYDEEGKPHGQVERLRRLETAHRTLSLNS